jgi:hypothetical protein
MKMHMPRGLRTCAAAAGLLILALPSTASATLGDRTLKQGDSGRDVKTLQRSLNKIGIRTTVDGVYGRGTTQRVKKFEKGAQRHVDGKLQPGDARALKSAARRGAEGGPDGATGTGGAAGTGGASGDGSSTGTASGSKAELSPDGRTAVAPADAPDPVKQAIAAANRITDKPYKYGGGHGKFEDTGYDCSGAVSYALHGGDLLDAPLDSSGLMSWGESGKGEWITVYAKGSHAYMFIAGLRFDTSGKGEEGPRWRTDTQSTDGYAVRHPNGL